MFTVRLSSVITGCGGKDTTRSRRSTRARTLSMNGSSSVSWPDTVLLYRPSRSMTAASACGISAIDLATTMAANTTSTPTRIRPATAPSIRVSFRSCPGSLDGFLDDGGGAVDVHDGHVIARLVDIAVVQGPRRPDFAVELHLTFVTRDPVEDKRTLAFQRLGRLR